MQRLHAVLFGLLLALPLSLIGTPPAEACSCAGGGPTRTEDEVIAEYDAVFSGSAAEEHDDNSDEAVVSSARLVRWVFQVDHVDKGDVDHLQEVFSAAEDASCGREFEIGTPYRVFAREVDGQLRVDLCDDTHALAEPGRYLSGDRQIVVPAAPEPPEFPEPVPFERPQPLPGDADLPESDEDLAPLSGQRDADDTATGLVIGALGGAAVIAVAWAARRRVSGA